MRTTSQQANKPTSLYKPLAALVAALALFFCAACPSESDDDSSTSDPAYCGTWTPTEELVTYLNAALEQATSDGEDQEEETEAEEETSSEEEADESGASSDMLSTGSISLTISSNSTVTVTVFDMIPIYGTYTYSGSDTEGTFYFTLDYSSLSSFSSEVAGMAQLIGSAFTGEDTPVAYETGSLSVVLDTDSEATTIFTK